MVISLKHTQTQTQTHTHKLLMKILFFLLFFNIIDIHIYNFWNLPYFYLLFINNLIPKFWVEVFFLYFNTYKCSIYIYTYILFSKRSIFKSFETFVNRRLLNYNYILNDDCLSGRLSGPFYVFFLNISY